MTLNPGRWGRTALAVSLGLLSVPSSVRAQEFEAPDAQVWLDYNFHGDPKESWRTSFDLGYRQVITDNQLFGEWIRVHLRGGAAWRKKNWLSLEAGLGGFYTYESRKEEEDILELRPWQGARVQWPTLDGPRRLALTHFARLEQRIVRSGGDTSFDLRFRYRLGTSIPLNKRTVQVNTLYVPFSIEGFLNPAQQIEETFADLLRITAGLGYVASANWTFRLVYIAQKSRNTSGVGFETTDHIVRFSVITTVKIKDLISTH